MKTQPSLSALVVTGFSLIAFLFLLLPNLLVTHVLAGFFLVLFIPGYSVIRLLPEKDSLARMAQRIGWSILLSFLVLSTCLLVFIIMGHGAFTLKREFLLGLGLVLAVLAGAYSFYRKPLSFHISRVSWNEALPQALLPLFIIAAGVTLPLFLNGYAQDNDGFLTLTIATLHGAGISATALRPLFATMLAAFTLITSSPVFLVYLLTPFILFGAAVLCFWGYVCEEIKAPLLRIAALLTLISTPVISIEFLTTRPQVIFLSFIIPLLILGIYAVKRNSWLQVGVGIAISLLLVPFHELSVTMLTLFVGISLYLVVRLMGTGKVTWKHLAMALIIAVPYLILFSKEGLFDRLATVIHILTITTTGIEWRWWFIGSYKSVDGAQLGWPGLTAAYYYLYNGILLYMAALVLALTLRFSRTKPNRDRAAWIVPGCFLAFFLFFAEVAPRFGFYFLLNRTWIYVALAACVCVVPLVKAAEGEAAKRQTWLMAAAALLAISGVAGSFLVARDNVSDVFPEEAGVISFLKTTPENSLVLSAQNNDVLVRLYAERHFLLSNDLAPLSSQTDLTLELKKLVKLPFVSTRESDTFSLENIIVDGVLVDEHKTLVTSHTEQVLRPEYHAFESLYFLYSKRKDQGLYAQRKHGYHEQVANPIPPVVAQDEVVFEDDNAIVYKLPTP
ncbi:MAG: hypothetical protein WCO52_05430 [bacterium]